MPGISFQLGDTVVDIIKALYIYPTKRADKRKLATLFLRHNGASIRSDPREASNAIGGINYSPKPINQGVVEAGSIIIVESH